MAKGGETMANRTMMTAVEIAEELGVSKAYAYKLIQRFNAELKQKGFTVISGKVSRKYFEEQFYGMADAHREGV